MPTLQFKGKNIIWNHHLSVSYHTLEEVEELNFQDDKSNGNLIIEGDNLIALKALLPQYAGRVKCIYIDPPYNTGNDNGPGKGWIYNDKVNSPLINQWFKTIVGKDDLTRHDKWCCMMAPRLKLLKELLTEDGLLFISIDDNETHHLRSICDEIFDENNLIANFIWRTDGNFDNQAKIKINHEYILCYANNKERFKFPEIVDPNITEESKLFNEAIINTIVKNGPKNPISEILLPVGFPANFESGKIKKRTSSYPHYLNDAIIENFHLTNSVYVSSGWSSKRNLELYIENNLTEVLDTKGQLTKFYITQTGAIEAEKSRDVQSHVISSLQNMGNTQAMSNELASMGINFSFPKPTTLIRHLISIIPENDFIVLDSFAGSGTTMHAVMDLNKKDEGNRQCILVQMREDSPEEPDKNICKDVTSHRIKKTIEKYSYESGFHYLRVGIPIDPESILSGNLPSYEQFAQYAYYLATGEHLADESAIDAAKHYVGTYGHQAIYLIYEQDMDKLTKLALNLDAAKEIIKNSVSKRRIVYAPACFLDEEYMEEHQIEFVSIPYNLFERKQNG